MPVVTLRRRRFPFPCSEALRATTGREIAMQRIQGYCVRCRATRELSDIKHIQRSGIPTVKGTCIVCGSTVFVLGAGAPMAADETSEA
jgi:hypothetical protein